MPHPLRRLIDALAIESGREAAARALAEHAGAHHLILLVLDPGVGAMLPAPGMRKTLVAGPSWRSFLQCCLTESELQGTVELEGREWHAQARVEGGCAFAFLYDATPGEFPMELQESLTLVAAALRAQQALRVGNAEAAEARDAAARARQLAVALDSARASAAELNRQLRLEHQRKDEFLAMLAHELRNPLAPVITAIEVLKRSSPQDVERRDRQLAVMSRQMQQLAHLVDDLLDISRVSRGSIELRREVLSVQQVLAAAIEASKPLIDSRRQTLRVERATGDLYVSGDRVRLIQVFSNLLSNAGKYTEPGGEIAVTVAEADGGVEIRVSDNGPGIPSEMLETIFDLFAQVPGALDRAPGGLGIGLTLVRSLVELHGGQVRALSEGVGCGSEFVVTLPVVKAVPAAAANPGPPPERDFATSVLVVDDNVDAASTLAEVLRLMGASVNVAHDGAQALALGARDPHPQLVLLDIGLPGMDGYETAREWRKRFGAKARLVALTGYGSADDRRRTAQAGFDGHLVKPVSVDLIAPFLGRADKPA
jgi:signal transduction histidine kinase/CheY-like chemotaxis protein